MASCRGRFEQLGHYFHPTSLLAHLGPVSRQILHCRRERRRLKKWTTQIFLCSSTEMEHPWHADWLSARWIYVSTNLSGIFRLHAIHFATISTDNQKAQVGTKDWAAFFWAMRQEIFLAFTLLILGVWQLVDAGWYSNEYRHFFLSTSMLVWVNFGVHSSSTSICPSDLFV